MEQIKLLDCTLRDGGYINDWKFGRRTIQNVIARLVDAGTDFIEVGFLRNVTYDEDRTLYNSIEELKRILPENRKKSTFVAMALHDQYDVSKLAENDGTIGAVRVTFHDYDIDEGLEFCRRVMDKGYPLFVNPINIMGYPDDTLLRLLEKVNRLDPYGFSIVDTFGSMTKAELTRIYSLLENNLDPKIVFGVHLHENLALSFSLAQVYLELRKYQRRSVLDASLNGMGRVPGNLCMELIMDFLNRQYGTAYDIDYVLDAIEEHILPIKKEEPWGYQTEYFLSAKYNLHRNYAEYLMEKGNLTTKEIKYLLKQLPKEKKAAFDRDYMERLYQEHENKRVSDEESLNRLKGWFGGRKVLLLAPGKSLERPETKKRILDYLKEEEAVLVTTNFYYDGQQGGAAFFSNARRLEEYRAFRPKESRLILTSNLEGHGETADYVINYERLVGTGGERCENSGILLLRLMGICKVREAALAGFDGFQKDGQNYMDGYFGAFPGARAEDNDRIAGCIEKLGNVMSVRFLTPSRYDRNSEAAGLRLE